MAGDTRGGRIEDHLRARRGGDGTLPVPQICRLRRQRRVVVAPTFYGEFFSKVWILAHCPASVRYPWPRIQPTTWQQGEGYAERSV